MEIGENYQEINFILFEEWLNKVFTKITRSILLDMEGRRHKCQYNL